MAWEPEGPERNKSRRALNDPLMEKENGEDFAG
jgi:hypothetical protein